MASAAGATASPGPLIARIRSAAAWFERDCREEGTGRSYLTPNTEDRGPRTEDRGPRTEDRTGRPTRTRLGTPELPNIELTNATPSVLRVPGYRPGNRSRRRCPPA